MVSRVLFVCLLGSLVLAGCGGGGGGGGTQAGSPTAPSTAPGLQIGRSSVEVESEHGEEVGTEFVEGVVNGATRPVFVLVQYTNRGLQFADFEQTTAQGGRLRLGFRYPADLAPGTYVDEVGIDVCYDAACREPVPGSPKRVPVTYRVKAATPAPALLLSREAVALAQVPFGSRLSASVSVQESGTNAGWTATSDAAWLSVTPSGASGAQLRLQAAVAGLAPGQHEAVVEVRSANPQNTRAAAIRVGLYVSATPSATAFEERLGDEVLVDPSRPLVYVVREAQLDVYHVYTGRRVASVPVSPSTARLGHAAITPDGRRIAIADQLSAQLLFFDTDLQAFDGSIAITGLQTPGRGGVPQIVKANGRTIAVVAGLEILSPSFRVSSAAVDVDRRVQVRATRGWSLAYVAEDGRHVVAKHVHSPAMLEWLDMTENSRGTIMAVSRTGPHFLSLATFATTTLTEAMVLAPDGGEVVSCEGTVLPVVDPARDFFILDSAWAANLAWQTPNARNCSGIRNHPDGSYLVADLGLNEFQRRKRDGTLLLAWMNSGRISEYTFQTSSDGLRVFDSAAALDLPQ